MDLSILTNIERIRSPKMMLKTAGPKIKMRQKTRQACVRATHRWTPQYQAICSDPMVQSHPSDLAWKVYLSKAPLPNRLLYKDKKLKKKQTVSVPILASDIWKQ